MAPSLTAFMAARPRRRVEPVFNAGNFILVALLLVALVFAGPPTMTVGQSHTPGAADVHR